VIGRWREQCRSDFKIPSAHPGSSHNLSHSTFDFSVDIFLLIVGLGLILAGANFLTDGSAALAQRFRVPEFIIGLTVVAVGTSMPEMVVSVLSAIAGNSDVAIGNIVGSNIFNVFVILGICALIRPIRLTPENIRRDIPAGVVVSLVLLAVTSDRLFFADATDRINRIDGVVMILLYMAVMCVSVRAAKRSGAKVDSNKKPPMALWLTILMIVGGLAGLIFGGEMFLDNATAIARRLGVSESLIAITLVAGGTSLPELASSVVSLLKGKSEMALGNVIGSNIANILLILGISSTINPLTMGGITKVDILMVLLSSLMLLATAYTFRKKKIDRWEGAIFLAIYVGYIWYLI
jgi:K+-dependent Na+/Ca+ exchanger family protein